jgi:hypothetical protein
MRLGLARGDLRDLDQHDRVPDMRILYRPLDGVVIQRGPAEELPDLTVAGDSGVFPGVSVDGDHDALDIGEGALAPSVGIAGEAAGGETAGALAASARDACVAPDGGVGADRSGESPRGSRRMSCGGRLVSSRMSRGGTPVARSASTARRAVSSLGYVLLSVVM